MDTSIGLTKPVAAIPSRLCPRYNEFAGTAARSAIAIRVDCFDRVSLLATHSGMRALSI